MTLKDILTDNAFKFGVEGNNKEEIIKEIADFFAKTYSLDAQTIFEALWSREQKGSTGLGKGLAIPHARIPGIETIKLAVFYSKEGKDFDAYDHIPTNLFFAAIIDEKGHPQEQLEMLRIIVESCEKTDLMTELTRVKNSKELRDIVIRRISEIQNLS